MINNFKLIKDLKPGSVFLVEDREGERFVLKQSAAAARLVKFSELVHQRGGELAELMPVFWAKDNWVWQKFLTWELAGDTVESYGIKSETFVFVNPERLARAICQLQLMPFTDPGMDTRFADFYLKNTSEFRRALTEEFSSEHASKVEQFLLLKKDLVNKQSRFLANGDLHPQNIMYQGKKFMLIDWDLLHFNNPGWDLTDLYVWGWRNSSWQDRLLNEYKQSFSSNKQSFSSNRKIMPTPISDFEEVFAFDVVYLSSQLIKHTRLANLPQEFLEAQKEILKAYLSHF